MGEVGTAAASDHWCIGRVRHPSSHARTVQRLSALGYDRHSIQARCRCHPTLPPGTSRTMCDGHEYERGGALAYLAAYDVHRAHVIGLCSDTTGTIGTKPKVS